MRQGRVPRRGRCLKRRCRVARLILGRPIEGARMYGVGERMLLAPFAGGGGPLAERRDPRARREIGPRCIGGSVDHIRAGDRRA